MNANDLAWQHYGQCFALETPNVQEFPKGAA
jgi:hypothetical protein